MTDTQKHLLGFIKFFDEFCRENNIEYFLAGGTLLGAVRHKGFLPWDDDMDLYMKRSEWERARDIFAEKLPSRYKVVCDEFNPDYHNTIARICDTQTTAFYRSRLADNTPHGVQIEIFMLEPMSDDPKERERLYSDYWAYYEATNPYMTQVARNALDYRRLSYEDYLSILKLIDRGDTKALAEKEAAFHRWKDDEVEKYHEAWAIYWLEYPVKAFASQIYLPFEDTKLPCPVGFADVLYGEYGDNWMELPSVENQAFHDDFEDYDIPYKAMEPCIEAQMDRKKYLEAQLQRNRDFVERAFLKESIKRKVLEYGDQSIRDKYNSDENKKKCAEAFEKGAYDEVLKVMNSYITRQWKGFADNFLYTLEDDLMYEVLYSSFMQGELKFVDRVRRNMLTEPEPRLADIFTGLEDLREVRSAFYYETLPEVRDKFRVLFSKYPDQMHLRILDLMYRMEDGEDPEALYKEAEALLDKYPNFYRLQKFAADLLIKAGKSDAGMQMYSDILKVSNDGMVNNDIRAILQKA